MLPHINPFRDQTKHHQLPASLNGPDGTSIQRLVDFKPATHGLKVRCAARLRYRPISFLTMKHALAGITSLPFGTPPSAKTPWPGLSNLVANVASMRVFEPGSRQIGR